MRWGRVELGGIYPLGHSDVPSVDFEKSGFATPKGKPTPEGQEPRA